MITLGEIVEQKRKVYFVGRCSELERCAALWNQSRQTHLLFFWGPGGIGKTWLLKEALLLAEQSGIAASLVETNRLPPTPKAWSEAIQSALDRAMLASKPNRALSVQRALFLDASNLGQVLESWLFETLIPVLDDRTVVIIAARQPPSSNWLCDPAFMSLAEIVQIEPLDELATRHYFTERRVPESRLEELIATSQGYPMAMSLMAELVKQQPNCSLSFSGNPVLVQDLLSRLVDNLPSQEHRLALWTAAFVGNISQLTLNAVLPDKDTGALLDWMYHLSFVRSGSQGVVFPSFIKDLLWADLEWRNPAVFFNHATSIIQHCIDSLDLFPPTTLRETLFDLVRSALNLFLSPKNSIFHRFQADDTRLEPVNAGIWPRLIESLERQEGQRAGTTLEILRDSGAEILVLMKDGAANGFTCMLNLNDVSPALLAADPGTSPLVDLLQNRPRALSGGPHLYFRFWMANDTYQDFSPIQSRIFLHIIETVLCTADLQGVFVAHRDPELWAPMTALAEIDVFPEASFSMNGKSFGVFGKLFDTGSPCAWVKRATRNFFASEMMATGNSLHVLDRDQFVCALKSALRQADRPDLLKDNPLLGSSLLHASTQILEQDMPAEDLLINLIEDHARTLFTAQRDRILYRVIEETYFKPGQKQMAVASHLNLSFTTYRRYLSQALERLGKSLWDREQQTTGPRMMLSSR